MALNQKGYPLLADDICALHFTKGNPPYVYPSFSQIKIGTDSATALKINTSNLSSTPSKHLIPIERRSEDQKHTIKTIFSIEQSDKNHIETQELHGAKKLAVLVKNTYTVPEIIAHFGKTKTHFKQCSIIAKLYKIKQIYRTNSLNNLEDLVSKIESEF